MIVEKEVTLRRCRIEEHHTVNVLTKTIINQEDVELSM